MLGGGEEARQVTAERGAEGGSDGWRGICRFKGGRREEGVGGARDMDVGGKGGTRDGWGRERRKRWQGTVRGGGGGKGKEKERSRLTYRGRDGSLIRVWD